MPNRDHSVTGQPASAFTRYAILGLHHHLGSVYTMSTDDNQRRITRLELQVLIDDAIREGDLGRLHRLQALRATLHTPVVARLIHVMWTLRDLV